MRSALFAGLLGLFLYPDFCRAQSSQAPSAGPVVVFTDHPRLFLRPARLLLLRKERERASARWQQLEAYVSADAPMPESAFAQALYYQISGDRTAGRKAVAWALGPGSDLRQLALIFDWCLDLLTESERPQLAARIQSRMEAASADESIAAFRSRSLAAVALFDEVPAIPNRELDRIVHTWWEGRITPALNSGRRIVTREDAYPLWELLHAVRDNTNLDLRESSARFFKQFPLEHLMSHYPATYRGDDNDFHIGASSKPGEPDLEQAALSRAAELAMVSFDNNAEESQYLQGWLMHDHFSLRGPFGAPYEFLWANPYQPGLSFTLLPLLYHNPESGTVFVRSDWDESADWFGYFENTAQWFHDGRLHALAVSGQPPINMQSALIHFGSAPFRVTATEGQEAVVLAGLSPNRLYQVEIDDEEVVERAADPGGVLVLDLLPGKQAGVRIREAPRQPATPAAR